MVTQTSAVAFRQNLGEMLSQNAADLPALGTFLAAAAAYLITGDQDLLALADRHPILTPAEYWAGMAAEPPALKYALVVLLAPGEPRSTRSGP